MTGLRRVLRRSVLLHPMRVIRDRADDLRPHRDRQSRGPCPRSSGAWRRESTAAVSRPAFGRTSGSTVPWITSVGVLSDLQALLAAAGGQDGAELPSGAGRIEAARKDPLGQRRDPCASSSGKLPTRRIFQVCLKRAMYSSRVFGGGRSSSAIASRVGCGNFGLPVDDMTEVSERTRSGYDERHFLRDHAAHRGADQMGRPDAEAVQQADHVVGHVAELVGRRRPGCRRSAVSAFRPWSMRVPPLSQVDLPMSRLSNRITRKPRAASCRQKSSSHSIIWAPSPMISSSGSASSSPKIS